MEIDNKPGATNGGDLGDQIKPGTSSYHSWDARSDIPDFSDYPVVRTIPVSSLSCVAVKFKGDGTQIATANGIPDTHSETDAPVKIWDVETGQLAVSLAGHTKGANDVSWSHDKRLLASASDDKTVRIWDVTSGKCIRTLRGHTHDVTCCSFNGSDTNIASASMDETVRIWDVQNGNCIRTSPAHSDPVTYVDFYPISHPKPLLVSASLDGISRVWDSETGSCLRSVVNAANLPLSFATFTPNTRFILLGMIGGRMELWDYKEVKRKKVYKGHLNKYFWLKATFLLNDPAPQPENLKGGYVLCGSEDHHVYVWHLNKPDKLGPQLLRGRENKQADGQGHYSTVMAVDTSPVQPLIASAAARPDGSVKLWKSVRSSSL